MPKVNRVTDRAHTILSFDLNQRDFPDFVEEIRKSKFFPNLVGIEVKRPNYGNPVLGLGALLLQTVERNENGAESTEAEESEVLESDITSEDGDLDDVECN